MAEKLYNKSNIMELYKDESYFEETFKLRERFDDSEIFRLDNPGVSFVFFTQRANPTPI